MILDAFSLYTQVQVKESLDLLGLHACMFSFIFTSLDLVPKFSAYETSFYCASFFQ